MEDIDNGMMMRIKNADIRAAVDLGRLFQFRGQRFQETFDDDEAPCIGEIGPNQRPVRVQQSQTFNQQVVGNKPDAEYERENDGAQDKVASVQVFLRQAVGHRKRNKQV